MTKYQNALPENIGIIKKLCLEADDEGEAHSDNSYPYQLAVEELQKLLSHASASQDELKTRMQEIEAEHTAKETEQSRCLEEGSHLAI